MVNLTTIHSNGGNMEYDNNNTGAIFTNNANVKLQGTGSIIDEGETKRICMTKDVMPDGTDVRDIYVKIGRLWDNKSDTPNAPTFTGVCETSTGEKRLAAWVKQTEKGAILSMKLSEKNEMQSNNTVDNSSESDEIPF